MTVYTHRDGSRHQEECSCGACKFARRYYRRLARYGRQCLAITTRGVQCSLLAESLAVPYCECHRRYQGPTAPEQQRQQLEARRSKYGQPPRPTAPS